MANKKEKKKLHQRITSFKIFKKKDGNKKHILTINTIKTKLDFQ